MNGQNEPPNFYAILGVSPDASQDEVRRAHRRLVMQWHPDRNKSPDAHRKMQDINEAYEVLGDEEIRAEYDRDYFAYLAMMAENARRSHEEARRAREKQERQRREEQARREAELRRQREEAERIAQRERKAKERKIREERNRRELERIRREQAELGRLRRERENQERQRREEQARREAELRRQRAEAERKSQQEREARERKIREEQEQRERERIRREQVEWERRRRERVRREHAEGAQRERSRRQRANQSTDSGGGNNYWPPTRAAFLGNRFNPKRPLVYVPTAIFLAAAVIAVLFLSADESFWEMFNPQSEPPTPNPTSTPNACSPALGASRTPD